MSKLSGTLTGIRFIENIKEGLDYCEVTIDFDELKYFGDYNDCLANIVNKEVYYDTMADIYKGEHIVRVANMAIVYSIQTVEATTMAKIIPEKDYTRAVCNFESANFKFGDYQTGLIGFLSKYEVGSSDKSTWVDMEIVDRASRVFKLRKFTKDLEFGEGDTVESLFDALIGHYVKFDMSNTAYGFQAKSIEPLNQEVIVPPEVAIAEDIINNAISGDAELLQYVKKHDLVNYLRGLINYEPGYHLVYIAAEIYMINSVCNISEAYDRKLMIRAALTSRGYLKGSGVSYSKSVLNVNRLLATDLKNDTELVLILDVLAEQEMSPTKKAYIEINRFVKNIMDERRGIKNETDIIINSVNSTRAVLGWML